MVSGHAEPRARRYAVPLPRVVLVLLRTRNKRGSSTNKSGRAWRASERRGEDAAGAGTHINVEEERSVPGAADADDSGGGARGSSPVAGALLVDGLGEGAPAREGGEAGDAGEGAAGGGRGGREFGEEGAEQERKLRTVFSTYRGRVGNIRFDGRAKR